jgi:hypothetical protein
MHKIHEVIFALTVSVHVSMDTPPSSGNTKCYSCQSIRKCEFFLHTSNLVYNKNLMNEQRVNVKLINCSILLSLCTETQSLNICTCSGLYEHFRHKCTWFKKKWNALKIRWNLQDLVNFRTIVALEYYVFYLELLFVVNLSLRDLTL